MLLSTPLPISCPYFRNILICSISSGYFAEISNPAKAKMLVRSEKNCFQKYEEIFQYCLKTPFLMKSHLLYTDNPLNKWNMV